jgi:signal peptidase I
MEKSLLVGDFLFVSKATYGTRLPMTPLAFPFAHNTLPLTDSTKSYLEWMQMPFKRLPAFTQIKNNDVVVFNYPYENGRPTDKKENYIKRCLAISGDSIQVIGGQVYINGIAAENQPKMQTRYMVKLDEKGNWNEKRFQDMMKKFDLTEGEQLHGNLDFAFPLTMESKQALEQEPGIISVDSLTDGKEIIQNYIFPQSPLYPWNTDNFGPLYVPKAGAIVHLDSMTFPLYQHAIRVYENNPSFECKDGKYFVEGKEISTYQFKYNYYFMMGDNRHNSADSRFWGFVPETHIVGKAFFVWMSWDKNGSNIFEKIRWNRIFKFIH